jgi:hypothetical protein
VLPARDNPFAVHRVLRERYRLDEAGWDALVGRLAAQDWRGAIVGPHGSGKTTLLEDLAARLEARGWRAHWLRLSAESSVVPAEFSRRVLPALGARDALLVDGAEQLGIAAWWALCLRARRSGALIATMHRAGRMPVVHRCATSPELLRGLADSLGASLAPADAVALHARHRGNIREALRELYDVAAARGGVTSSGPGA